MTQEEAMRQMVRETTELANRSEYEIARMKAVDEICAEARWLLTDNRWGGGTPAWRLFRERVAAIIQALG